MNSKFLSLNIKDFAKGVIMAVLGAVVTYVYGIINSGNFNIDWNSVWKVAAAAFVAYLVKNIFTNSDGQPLSKENK